MMRFTCFLLLCFTLLGATLAAVADEHSFVVTTDGDRFPAQLTSVDSDGIVTHAAGENTSGTRVAMNELVRWSHPSAPRPRQQVLLADGTLLVAAEDWTGRGSLQISEEVLTVVTTGFDEVRVPRRLVTAVLLSPPHDPIRYQQLVDALQGHDDRTDKLWLAGGDRVTGAVEQFDGHEWTIHFDAGDLTLPAAGVEAVAFNPLLVDQVPPAETVVAVGFRDGSLVYAESLQADRERLSVTSLAQLKLDGPAIDDIASLQSVQNSRITYLSDLEPADYRQVPYLDLDWPWQPDRNLLGGRLHSGGQVYLKGIAMHSAARLTFALDGAYRNFAADIALDDAAGNRGSVVFRVFVAREGQWQDAFTSEVVRGGDPPQPISVDLADAQAITLIVDYADRGDELDHANWLDARLVK